MFVFGPESVEKLERAVRRTREYDADIGTVTNLEKTSCATRRARDKEAMKKVARELGIRHASIESQVGSQVAFQKTRPRELQIKRAKKTMRTVLRVAQLPPLFPLVKESRICCVLQTRMVKEFLHQLKVTFLRLRNPKQSLLTELS